MTGRLVKAPWINVEREKGDKNVSVTSCMQAEKKFVLFSVIYKNTLLRLHLSKDQNQLRTFKNKTIFWYVVHRPCLALFI